jgi:hypothetical protein
MKSGAGALVPILVGLAAVAGVAATQPRLATTVHEVKERDDIVAFPPPDQLRMAVLGWDAAAVDLLWSSLLVAYGTHFSERREFNEIPRYVDAILGLEPDYAALYKYVDTMLAYRPLQGTRADVILARKYLERGTQERPQDANVWLRYGQFIAFVAPSFLTDDSERAEWRKAGALAMEHAVELGADADEAIAASSMLSRAGEVREAIRYLENAYAFTEHPAMHDIHEAIGRRLAALETTAQRDAADRVQKAVDARWAQDLPTVSRDAFLLLGPVTDPARCAGLAAVGTTACARSWDEATAERGSSAGSP